MSHRITEDEEEHILSLYRQGVGPNDISAATGIKYGSIKHLIARKRKELGTASVPYINDQSKFRPKKAASQAKVGTFAKDEITTWAGAFKALALYLHDIGDADGWALAKDIAKAKGMLTL
jgi:hypothetical protein